MIMKIVGISLDGLELNPKSNIKINTKINTKTNTKTKTNN